MDVDRDERDAVPGGGGKLGGDQFGFGRLDGDPAGRVAGQLLEHFGLLGRVVERWPGYRGVDPAGRLRTREEPGAHLLRVVGLRTGHQHRDLGPGLGRRLRSARTAGHAEPEYERRRRDARQTHDHHGSTLLPINRAYLHNAANGQSGRAAVTVRPSGATSTIQPPAPPSRRSTSADAGNVTGALCPGGPAAPAWAAGTSQEAKEPM